MSLPYQRELDDKKRLLRSAREFDRQTIDSDGAHTGHMTSRRRRVQRCKRHLASVPTQAVTCLRHVAAMGGHLSASVTVCREIEQDSSRHGQSMPRDCLRHVASCQTLAARSRVPCRKLPAEGPERLRQGRELDKEDRELREPVSRAPEGRRGASARGSRASEQSERHRRTSPGEP